MKKIMLIMVLAIMLTGCNPKPTDDNQGIITKDVQLNDEILSVLDANDVVKVLNIDQTILVTYYTSGSMSTNNFGFLIYSESEGLLVNQNYYKYIYHVEKLENDSFYIKYCESLMSCEYTIYNVDGDVLFTGNNISKIVTNQVEGDKKNIYTSMDSHIYPLYDSETDIYYSVESKEIIDEYTEGVLYQFYKFENGVREVLYEFSSIKYFVPSINELVIWQLSDMSFLFSYQHHYTPGSDIEMGSIILDHVSSSGELISSRSEEYISVWALEEGYLFLNEESIEVYSNDGVLEWGMNTSHLYPQVGIVTEKTLYIKYFNYEVQQLRTIEMSIAGEVLSDTVFSEDDFPKETDEDDLIGVLPNGSEILISSDQDTLKVTSNDVVLWEVEFDSILNVYIHESGIYISMQSMRNKAVIKYDFSGNIITSNVIGNDILYVNEEGNIISQCDNKLCMIDVSENIIWETGNFDNINVEAYTTDGIIAIEYLSSNDTLLSNVSNVALVSSTGDLIATFEDEHSSYYFVGEYDGIYYIMLEDDIALYNSHNLYLVDSKGEVISEYIYIYHNEDGVYWLDGDTLTYTSFAASSD